MLRKYKMSVELKIKSKHLSEEARIIRFEERKLYKQYQWSLNKYIEAGNNDMYPRWEDKAFMAYTSIKAHRRKEVRNENRATFLARAYLAGKDYKTVEQKCHDTSVLRAYIFPRICEMTNKYNSSAQTKLNKKWNRERNRYEYDPKLWQDHQNKVSAWLGFIKES
jgi:hypothetical protein